MYPTVKKVIPRDNYKLIIEFDNAESRMLDMKPFLEFGLFSKLKKREEFKKVKVSFDTIEWEIGLDLDPEFVYEKSVRIK